MIILNILDLLNDYYGTESTTLEEFVVDIKESDGWTIPHHVFSFYKYVQRKES